MPRRVPERLIARRDSLLHALGPRLGAADVERVPMRVVSMSFVISYAR
jgi:hypothetical protein